MYNSFKEIKDWGTILIGINKNQFCFFDQDFLGEKIATFTWEPMHNDKGDSLAFGMDFSLNFLREIIESLNDRFLYSIKYIYPCREKTPTIYLGTYLMNLSEKNRYAFAEPMKIDDFLNRELLGDLESDDGSPINALDIFYKHSKLLDSPEEGSEPKDKFDHLGNNALDSKKNNLNNYELLPQEVRSKIGINGVWADFIKYRRGDNYEGFQQPSDEDYYQIIEELVNYNFALFDWIPSPGITEFGGLYGMCSSQLFFEDVAFGKDCKLIDLLVTIQTIYDINSKVGQHYVLGYIYPCREESATIYLGTDILCLTEKNRYAFTEPMKIDHFLKYGLCLYHKHDDDNSIRALDVFYKYSELLDFPEKGSEPKDKFDHFGKYYEKYLYLSEQYEKKRFIEESKEIDIFPYEFNNRDNLWVDIYGDTDEAESAYWNTE